MFSDDQIDKLEAPLSRDVVKSRKQGGRNLSYVEGWHVIAEANRIFGFDSWTRETVELRLVAEAGRAIGEEKAPGWGVTYICRVRVTIRVPELVGGVVRDGCGAGHGIDRDLGQAHESAVKEAETDAMKRAFMTFGNPFGLALYDKDQTNVVDQTEIVYRRFVLDAMDVIEAFGADHEGRLKWWNAEAQKEARRAIGLHPDDLTTLKNLVLSKAPQKTEQQTYRR